MKSYIFDTSALLTLRDNESGSEQIADLLYQAESEKIKGLVSFISLMEVLYRVWKDEGEQAGRFAYEQVHSLPLTIIHESAPLLEKAAAIKATHHLSLADAWIAATAILEGATLVHKDPEFGCIQCRQIKLPYKEKK